MGPAAVPDALGALARRLPRHVRLGTSSWSFPGWNGLVYDREAAPARLAREGLAAYGRHPLLRTVGIDRTFYAPLPAEAFAAYAAAVPEDFRFLVKAPAECTTPFVRDTRASNPRFLDARWTADEAVTPYVEGLGPRAGVLLFQFPPLGPAIIREPERFAARLAGFLAALPRGARYAVELRDRALLCPDYAQALSASGAGHCLNVHPRMPRPAEQREVAGAAAAGPLVIRWMLHAGLSYEQARSRYAPFSRLVDEAPEVRAELAGLCADESRNGREVIVVANNKAEGSAPLTVFKLAAAIAEGLEAAGAGPGR